MRVHFAEPRTVRTRLLNLSGRRMQGALTEDKQRTYPLLGSPQTVHDLRRQWKPHKERLATVRSEHPTAIRFHRACSWMTEVEPLEPVPPSADQILFHQWIDFHALYGQWD